MTTRFAIEDNDHCQDISTHADLAEALDALHALARAECCPLHHGNDVLQGL